MNYKMHKIFTLSVLLAMILLTINGETIVPITQGTALSSTSSISAQPLTIRL